MPIGRRAKLYNALAAVCLGLAVVSVGWVVGVTLNPYSWFNPLPPVANTLEPVEPWAVATATIAPSGTPASTLPPLPEMSPVATEVASARASSSPLAAPSVTMPLVTTPSVATPPSPTPRSSATPKPTPTRSVFTYTAVITLQVHPVQVCDWMGVAGVVTDLQGKPVLGAFARVQGTGNVDQVVAVGVNPMYGASGWEVRLARAQIVGNWTVQLVSSPEGGSPISDVYAIPMPGDCKKNLAFVRFEQNH